MAYTKIKPRRGTATQWNTANPVLAEGEIGIEVPDDGIGTGLTRIKFGDGVTAWDDLPYGVITPADSIVQNLDSDATDKVPSVGAVKAGFDLVNTNLYELDYDNVTPCTFSVVNQTFTVPKNGIISINWRNQANANGTVALKSSKRGDKYLYIDSRYSTGEIYAFHECMVVEGEIITITVLASVKNNSVSVHHYPFK